MDKPRVLFVTVPIEVLAGASELKGKVFDTVSPYQGMTAMSRKSLQMRISSPSFGLRFIQENIKGVDILDHPTLQEYKSALKRGYDVIGISFFTWTTPDAVKMAEMAHDAGVRQVWGGNYGVMTPGVDKHFDRLFYGNCEAELHEAIHGENLSELAHPVLVGRAKWMFWKWKIGYLYTKRGCKSICTFCPTQSFTSGKDESTPLQSIKRTLDAYQRLNIKSVVIFDETFLEQGKKSDIIIEEMMRRKLKWVCMTRADRILGRVKELKKNGMYSAVIGVESIRDDNLRSIRKRVNSALVKEVILELNRSNCLPTGTYMLGLPNDTPERLLEDIRELSTWGFYLSQFTLFTPFPGTILWKELEDKILDKNWRNYDLHHLVYDHPHMNNEEARELLYHALTSVNRPSRYMGESARRYIDKFR